MRVRDLMTTNVEWIEPDITIAKAAVKMRDLNIGCLPVGENDRLIGMLTDRDLACRAVAGEFDPKTTLVREVMTKGITWCHEESTIEDAIELMEQKQIHHMPVINRGKRMVGVLSMSDFALRGPADLLNRLSALVARDAQRHGRTVVH